MNEWSEEKERNILKRSKWLLTIKIIKILLIIGLCYAIYMVSITVISKMRGTELEDEYYMKVATSMKYPNIFVKDQWFQDESINAFGTREFSASLVKYVGKEESLVVNVKIKKGLINRFSSIRFQDSGLQALSHLSSFVLPNEGNKQEDAEPETTQFVWQQLEKLHEGTVSELKFTTHEFMSPEDLLEKLAPYDLDVLWMPLFTGEFESFEPSSYGRTGEKVEILDKIGLYGGHGHGANGDFNYRTNIHTLQSETIHESKQLLLDNMEEMLDKGSSYYKEFLRMNFLEERYKYLQENGFQVYGAVVTGPTKELLKLRSETGIHEVQLGDVALWNWE